MDVIFPRDPEYTKNAPAVACPYFQCLYCVVCDFYKGDHCSTCLRFSGLCKDCMFCDSDDCRSAYYNLFDKSDYFELDVITVMRSGRRYVNHYFAPILHVISVCQLRYLVGEYKYEYLSHEIYDDSGIMLAKLTRKGHLSTSIQVLVNVI